MDNISTGLRPTHEPVPLKLAETLECATGRETGGVRNSELDVITNEEKSSTGYNIELGY